MMYLLQCLIVLSLSLCVLGCSDQVPVPDYTVTSSWAHLPENAEKPVDVFYVYPTIYAEESPLNMDFTRKDLQGRIANLMFSQAGVFTPTANLYAPYYRQMSFAVLNPEEDMYQNRYFRIGAGDVTQAFDFYLKNHNDGRPFILAGHSQGSMVLVNLMQKRFDDPALQKQLVAAYLIGYSVTDDDLKKFPWLKSAAGKDDTGVIISYNTQAPNTTGSPVLLPGAICINPLNWKTDGTPAEKPLNLGAVFYDNQGKLFKDVSGYCGATINSKIGALETSPPETLDIGNFPKGVYHKFDYPFFYRNLEKNIKTRCAAYLNPSK